MFQRIKDKWNEMSTGKKGTIIGSIVAVIVLICFSLFAFFRDGGIYDKNKAKDAKENIAQIDKKASANHGMSKSGQKKNPKFLYNQVHNVPNLTKFNQYQDEVADGDEVIVKRGNLSIPYLSIQAPIYEGTTDWTLASGLGTAKPNQVMGKGNYSVAGHNFLKVPVARNFFFTNFQKALAPSSKPDMNLIRTDAVGHNAYLAGAKDVYTYKIKKAEIVSWKDGYQIDDSKVNQYNGKPILTMYTCYEQSNLSDNINPPYRIVMTGVLEKKQSINEFKKEHKNDSNIFNQLAWLKQY